MASPCEVHVVGASRDEAGHVVATVAAEAARIEAKFSRYRAGYIVEIDPLDPTSTPKKRTALGRFKHENAEVVTTDSGRIVVYMGDDERGGPGSRRRAK